jgi:hemerythrin superfamily protein
MADRPLTTMSTTDVVELLLADHEEAKTLLSRFEDVAPPERTSYFCEVVTDLVRHEVAEEHVVYPIIRQVSPEGKQEAKARIAEQSEAEELLAEMEKLDASSAEFTTKFIALRQAVLDHARSEEATTFPLLKEVEDAESRLALGGRYEYAKAKAPKHPHPHAPHTSPGNMILGPVAALFDKARDAVGDA